MGDIVAIFDAFDDTANAIAVLVLDPAISDDDKTFEASKLSLVFLFFLSNSLSTSNDVAAVVPELAFSIGSKTRLPKLLGVAFNELADLGDVLGVCLSTSLVELSGNEERELLA